MKRLVLVCLLSLGCRSHLTAVCPVDTQRLVTDRGDTLTAYTSAGCHLVKR